MLRARILLLRFVCGAFAIAASYWAGANILTLSQAARLTYVSDHIQRTEPYKSQTIQVLTDGNPTSTPEALHAHAVISERLLEIDLLNARRVAVDRDIVRTTALITDSLKVTPTDSFLWLSLYWIRTIESGFSEKNLPLLRMSYATGHNEGWIALRRNRLAFIVYAYLPKDLAAKATEEFLSLVSNRFTQTAVDILTGAAWAERGQLLNALDAVPIDERQRFAKSLYDAGYAFDVPGVRRSDERPWHQFDR